MDIYGLEISVPTNFVRFTANYLKLDYEFKRLNLLLGENKAESYLIHSPAGKIPALVDGDVSIFESNAICRYLAHKYGDSSLLGLNDRSFAVDSWVEYLSHHLRLGVYQMVYNTYIFKVVGKERSEQAYQEGLELVNECLRVVDNQLQGDMLLGDKLTLADLSLVSALDPLTVLEFNLQESYPKIHSYFINHQKQDFYQKCHQSFQRAFAMMMINFRL